MDNTIPQLSTTFVLVVCTVIHRFSVEAETLLAVVFLVDVTNHDVTVQLLALN